MNAKTSDTINNKVIYEYQDCNIKIILEIPAPNEERDINAVKVIREMMSNELLLQVNNQKERIII